MNTVTVDRFDEYFQALHGYSPYPWQRRLAERVIQEGWPGAIDLPTGSGKTACIDIAVFALACQASLPVEQHTAPRRIFFCVNRRVIVDEAHSRARRIAESIWVAERNERKVSILRDVAVALRVVAGASAERDGPPLDVTELRGGIYNDSRWARSIIQPTIVCTTLDQIGSRLLFRGYGVSPNAAPIQAALIAYDCLILLDEAHVSEPFRQTLESVQGYLDPVKWAEYSIGVQPVCVVPMTATPNDEMRSRGVIKLEADDRATEPLNDRLSAKKPAELQETDDVINDAVQAALDKMEDKPVSVGIIVNRIATARGVYDKLRELQQEFKKKKQKIPVGTTIELVIGSMRPIDRDVQAERLRKLIGPDRPDISVATSFVVATQCLEVGADYDFDVLITECASLDALRQRFGRLNRAGRKDAQNNPVNTNAVIVIDRKSAKSEEQIKKAEAAKEPSKRYLDPIYGNALSRTWNWLSAHATGGIVDFGIDNFKQLLDEHGESGQPPRNLLSPSASLNAPVMIPAYMDFWCQTMPRPTPDPDVSLFIHGSQRSEPDAQVCWRADLTENDGMTCEHWCDVVAMLPPTSAECVSLPISRLRRWLADQIGTSSNQGDVLGVAEDDDDGKKNKGKQELRPSLSGVVWRGVRDTRLLTSPSDLRPGDTLVLPAAIASSRVLGHVFEAEYDESKAVGPSDSQRAIEVRDVAEIAFTRARDLAALRLHRSVRSRLPVGDVFDALFVAAARHDEPPTRREWAALLEAAASVTPNEDDTLRRTLHDLASNSIRIEHYPDKSGVVLTTRRRLNTSTSWFIRDMDEGDDESSRSQRDTPVTLSSHGRHVRDATEQALKHLPLESIAELPKLAAYLHDWGKADERFQAMLRRTDRTDAWLLSGATSAVLAKSHGMPTTRTQRNAACRRAGLPVGFRHEMLSIQFAELSGLLPDDPDSRALILHLIAAHHGYARPFAPVVIDDELPAVEFEDISVTHEQRMQFIPPHRLDSGVADRFWILTRRFGWWGLAYLESALRLADQQASAAEDAGKYDNEQADISVEATT